jgi:hypothetical protein
MFDSRRALSGTLLTSILLDPTDAMRRRAIVEDP